MWRLLALVIFMTLAACAQQAESDPLPDGAIQTGMDSYMIPLEQRDADGCQGYRQYSPTHMVTMALYYRTAASNGTGGFTANKMQADCYAKD
ncbi:MAG: hypothetical protein IID51_02135 [Proteobacteria bacterium]|nr:hypothetical protein [Pseudomonadota bacterium]